MTTGTSAESPTPASPVPADESPTTGAHRVGPTFPPTHPLAIAPVTSPPHSVDGFVREFLRELNTGQGVALSHSTVNDQYLALARTVRHYLMARWLETVRHNRKSQAKVVGYLSAEYLLGRQLDNALLATDLNDVAEKALASCGLDLATLRAQEVEPGLGNGGLGRLAACFIDSLATMGVPCIGYGIRYEYGIFRQTFVDGRQVEQPDTWLASARRGSSRTPRPPSRSTSVATPRPTTTDGTERTRWVPGWNVLGVPYNYMVPGYQNGRVNTLRLWSAQATKAFDLRIFNAGDYAEAVRAQTFAENITKVLYPEDSTPQGKELRLQQQYFFVACSIQDFLEHSLDEGFDLRRLPERIIFQLNDTHPVIAVPELMRVLVDEKGIEWDEAWEITQKCFAYTCHTLLPEALEIWSTELLGRLLPRHLEIIYRINDDFLAEVRAAYPDDEMRVRRMSIIAEHPDRSVRMAYLATVAGAKVNGVAALHSQLLRDKVLPDFSSHWPEKFTNVTNGVTPRRFLRLCEPVALGAHHRRPRAGLGDRPGAAGRARVPRRGRGLPRRVPRGQGGQQDPAVRPAARRDGIELPDDHMLDVMVKRLHEYKRQIAQAAAHRDAVREIISGRVDPRPSRRAR